MIEVSHLTKYYGNFLAVDDLSFEIGDGSVYGFLGPNGAGKSTTMNIITGCLSPTDGTVKIGGYDILEQPEKAKRLIGYLPEQPPVYPSETPVEYLTFVGEAKGLRRKALKAEIQSAIASVGMEQVQNQLIGTLSKGYRQRLGIAQALLGNPKVIILDEPTVGLDPIQIIEIRDLIKELGLTHTVILSSHILSEVQAVCQKVLIISGGKLVAFDAPENLEKLLVGSAKISFQVEANKTRAEEILSQVGGIAQYQLTQEGGICTVSAQLQEGANAQEICGSLSIAFAGQGLPVYEMRTEKANLEQVFLELTESSEPDVPAEAAEPAEAEESAEPAEPTGAETPAEPAEETKEDEKA